MSAIAFSLSNRLAFHRIFNPARINSIRLVIHLEYIACFPNILGTTREIGPQAMLSKSLDQSLGSNWIHDT